MYRVYRIQAGHTRECMQQTAQPAVWHILACWDAAVVVLHCTSRCSCSGRASGHMQVLCVCGRAGCGVTGFGAGAEVRGGWRWGLGVGEGGEGAVRQCCTCCKCRPGRLCHPGRVGPTGHQGAVRGKQHSHSPTRLLRSNPPDRRNPTLSPVCTLIGTEGTPLPNTGKGAHVYKRPHTRAHAPRLVPPPPAASTFASRGMASGLSTRRMPRPRDRLVGCREENGHGGTTKGQGSGGKF